MSAELCDFCAAGLDGADANDRWPLVHYELVLCGDCFRSSWEGITPDRVEQFLAHLAAKGLAPLPLNVAGRYPCSEPQAFHDGIEEAIAEHVDLPLRHLEIKVRIPVPLHGSRAFLTLLGELAGAAARASAGESSDLRSIGHRLHDLGGFFAMEAAAELVGALADAETRNAIDQAFDGIGIWGA